MTQTASREESIAVGGSDVGGIRAGLEEVEAGVCDR